MFISISQAIDVYDEIRNASEGKANWGGDTAEIYAYKLMPFKPSVKNEMTTTMAINAADSLISLIDLFLSKHDGFSCMIEDVDYKEWRRLVEDGYTHRCHVRMIKQQG